MTAASSAGLNIASSESARTLTRSLMGGAPPRQVLAAPNARASLESVVRTECPLHPEAGGVRTALG